MHAVNPRDVEVTLNPGHNVDKTLLIAAVSSQDRKLVKKLLDYRTDVDT